MKLSVHGVWEFESVLTTHIISYHIFCNELAEIILSGKCMQVAFTFKGNTYQCMCNVYCTCRPQRWIWKFNQQGL